MSSNESVSECLDFPETPRLDDADLHIVLIGKTGSGKSSTGNTILGESKFKNLLSFDSQTRKMQGEIGARLSRKLLVVDTPGLKDTAADVKDEDILYEIKRSFVLLYPGPHALVLVVKMGRYGEEDRQTANIFMEFFGKEMLSHLIVIFTGADELESQGGNFYDLLKKTKQRELQKLLQNCDGRYLPFNNKSDDPKQVEDLLNMIDAMVKKNGGMPYSNEIFRKIGLAMEGETKTPDEILKHIAEDTYFGKNFIKVVTRLIWGPLYLAGKAVGYF